MHPFSLDVHSLDLNVQPLPLAVHLSELRVRAQNLPYTRRTRRTVAKLAVHQFPATFREVFVYASARFL